MPENTFTESAPVFDLKSLIRDVPDYPKPCVLFKDITPLLGDPAGLALAVEFMCNPFRHRQIDMVMGTESRGFIFGTAIAQALSCGFVPIRKHGTLPRETHGVSYGLEYGTDTIEVHRDAVKAGQRVLLVDDLLATGGTLAASCELINRLGGDLVGIAVLIELSDLGGRDSLPHPELLHTVMRF